MTACVKNHSKRVALAISASLVGALSLGAAVPAVAFADDGMSTLALSASDAFKQGEMTEARDKDNRRLDIPADGIVTVDAGNYVVPRTIVPADSDAVRIVPDGTNANATITYYKNGALYSTWKYAGTGAHAWEAGTYEVSVTITDADSIYDGATFSTEFIVEDATDLSNATLFDMSNGATNVSDTTFTYNGSPQRIGVAVDGKVVASADYSMTIDKRLDANGRADAKNGVTSVVDAGTYIANITDASKGQVVAKITFKVNQVNLSTANVSVSDVDTVNNTTDTVKTVYVDGVPFNADASAGIKLLDTLAEVTSGQTGASSVIVTPNTNAGSNIVGTATVEFNVVDTVLTDAKYNGTIQFSTYGRTTNGLPINLADGESFKPERIQVFDRTDELDASYFTVSYTDANDNPVEASALSVPGTYYVTVRVNAEASHFKYGSGDITMKVVVSNGTVTTNDIVFRFDGQVGDHFEAEYTGKDFLPQVETIVHTQWGDDLVAGTDYTVTVENEDGEEVDSIVDAGTYTITLDIPGYNPSTPGDNECTFVVNPFNLSAGLFVNGGDVSAYTYDETHGTWPFEWTTSDTVWYLPYTGEAIEPSFELGYYTDADGDIQPASYVDGHADELVWHALPEDAYTVTGYRFNGEDVDEVSEKGDYSVQFALETGNYEITATGVSDECTSNAFTVSDAKVAFSDVSPDAWYAQSVFQAKQLGYVKGISGTSLYAPESSISRADALIIISRMAGFDQTVNAEDYLDANGGFLTRYSDVDEGAYYAKAVAWGTKVGIVHGDAGASTFRPEDTVTREEFAAMLSNYAKAMGDYEAVDADEVLAGVSGADTVSPWMREAVAWAKANGVMGNNGASLNAKGDITRAETAAMAVNYQPEGASGDVIG